MHGGQMVLWMPREGRMPPLKRSNDDLDVRDARGVGHHGALHLRSTTDHVHEGRDQTAETLTQATAPISLSLKEVE
jgi:hypothetical protein